MHPTIYRAFEEILTPRRIQGRVLEVGGTPNQYALLNMPCLSGAQEKLGINLEGPGRYRDFEIVQGNANAMTMFPDDSFDLILCNAMLEHDKCFWKTIAEIRRVTKPGGLAVLGVPAYVELAKERRFRQTRLYRWGQRLRFTQRLFAMIDEATVTYKVHNAPGDYYRFSEQAVKEIFFEGYEEIEVRTLMVPPRIIGVGRKKAQVLSKAA
jgi:ubiquinone/menaquinone biosynthesis C-methylase UbiE